MQRNFLRQCLRRCFDGKASKDKDVKARSACCANRIICLNTRDGSMLGTKADGDAERIAILLRFCFGMQ